MSWPDDVYLQIEIWSLSEPRKTTANAPVSARAQFLQSTAALTRDDEDLHRQNDEHVVDMEPRMAIVERQEPIRRQLRPEVIILPTEHLLAHTRADLRLEVQDRPKAQITALPALVVLRVLDTPAPAERVHTGVDVLVEVQALLRLGDTPARGHEERVEEVRVAVVQLPADPRKRARREHTERLLLARGQVTENTYVLRICTRAH